MVQKRREPTISSSDFSAPLDDDSPQRVGGGQTPRRQGKPAPPPPPAKGGSGMAVFAFLIAAVGLGVGGFAVWKNQEITKQLTSATTRIAALEKRLTLSDDESTQSVTALQANLVQAVKDVSTNESEIRKLWDTRNVNRKAIVANGTKAEKAAAQLQQEIKTLDQTVVSVKKEQGGLTGQLKEMAESSDSIDRQIAKLRTQVAELDGAASKLSIVDQLGSRVRNNEEAIEAIDAYRLNINRQLVELQQKLAPGQ